jgi:hypothetical protein
MFPRGRVLTLYWTLAILCLAAGPHGASDGQAPVRPTGSAGPEKVARFGVDAADWRVIDRLIAAGQLPAFARLKRVASVGILQADPPLLSPLIWTTIASLITIPATVLLFELI